MNELKVINCAASPWDNSGCEDCEGGCPKGMLRDCGGGGCC